jgi:cytochrome c oxidase assembly protein subunit 15
VRVPLRSRPSPSTIESTSSSQRFTRWAPAVLVANLIAQIGLIVTGGAVRLTGSGLGCSTWPQCEPGSFTPKLHGATSFHPLIEFGNRTLTGLLVIIAIAVAVLVFSDRRRSTGFRVLGLVPLIGVALQAFIGGATVLLHLNPAVVGVHLLLSMALVSASTLLVFRGGETDGRPAPLVGPGTIRLARALAVAAAVVLALGVVVTGAGPHGGDNNVAYRFAVDPVLVAKLHAAAVWIFVGLLIALLAALVRGGAPARARRAAFVLLGITLAQGLIGYVQYFTGLPAVLVGVHMLGAGLLTAATTWTVLTLRRR